MRVIKGLRCQRGETTISGILFALLFTFALMAIVNFSIMLYTFIQLNDTKSRADRAMSIVGGFNTQVQAVIENNLSGVVDLSELYVTATPYPVNRGEDYELIIEYNYPIGLVNWSGGSMDWSIFTIPLRSRSYGISEKVIR